MALALVTLTFFTLLVGCVTKTIEVDTVVLDVTELTLSVGEVSQLTANLFPVNATNKMVSWKSSDDNITTVTPDGTITARALGTVGITVTSVDGGKIAECTVTVTEPKAAEPVAPPLETRELALSWDEEARLYPTAHIMAVSPTEEHLIYSVAAAPVSPVFMVNLLTGNQEKVDLGKLGSSVEIGQVSFSADGKQLVASVFDYNYETQRGGALCLSDVDMLPHRHEILVPFSEEMLANAHAIWSSDSTAIYFVNRQGLMKLNLADKVTEQVYSSSQLPGLLARWSSAPVAFSIGPGMERMAYASEGIVYLLDIGSTSQELLEYVVGITVDEMKFSPDGKKIALNSDSASVLILDIETGNLIELARSVRSFAWNHIGELALLTNEARESYAWVYDFSSDFVVRSKVDVGSNQVLWVRDDLYLLVTGQDYYSLYKMGLY